MNKQFATLLFLTLVSFGCASGPPALPYPAFVEVDMLDDVFMASLPGVRAKQLAGDAQTRRTSNRINLPPDWRGTTGGVPGRSTEIFVLLGELEVADVTLPRGGYAYFPAGSLGFNLVVKEGAQILYFVNDVDPEAVIRAPIIIDTNILDWTGGATTGVQTKDLRDDPGNGSRTWLMRVAAGTTLSWQSSTVSREGYLAAGQQQYSECLDGEVRTSVYAPGGYFLRPANTIHGGPESLAQTDSVWFLREMHSGDEQTWPDCTVVPTP